MKYAIRVEEVIGRTIIVEAEALEEAIEKVEEACNNDDIFLDGIEDFVERNVFPSDNFKNGIVEDGRDVSFYEHLKERIMDNYYYEAVEVCPHCESENIYPMWNTEESGFVAVCKTCGKEILLCDECQHTILQDGEVHDCDWCKTECGGKCHRGCTRD